MNNTTQNGASVPLKQDNSPLSTIKPRSNESLYYTFKELSAFIHVVLNSLQYKKDMTYSEEEVLSLVFSKLEDLTDLYEQLKDQDHKNFEDNYKKTEGK